MEEQKQSLSETLGEIKNLLQEKDNKKTRELKLPRKSRVRGKKLKNNWLGILRIDDNLNISGEKQQIEDRTYKLKDGTYHATDGREIMFWQGKFPLVIQPTWKLNPLDMRSLIEGKVNETYGQKYVLARMLKDVIKIKKAVGNVILWGALVIGGLVAANYFLGK